MELTILDPDGMVDACMMPQIERVAAVTGMHTIVPLAFTYDLDPCDGSCTLVLRFDMYDSPMPKGLFPRRASARIVGVMIRDVGYVADDTRSAIVLPDY